MIQFPGEHAARRGSEYETQPSSVCAVIVTYQPGPDFVGWIHEFSTTVGQVVLIDNGSGANSLQLLETLRSLPNLTVQMNRDNIGLGAALNQGIKLAREGGFPWILTDSCTRPPSHRPCLRSNNRN